MKIFSLSILFFIILISASAQSNWELQKDKDGIKVYTKSNETSKLKSSKAEMVVDKKADRILEIISDISRYTEWNPKTISAETIKMKNNDDFYYRTVVKAPMVSNRDLVVHVQVKRKSKDYIVVEMIGVPDFIPEEKGLVRMPEYKGVYHLKTQQNGKTQVILEYMANPGGKLPDWLVNTAAVDVPFEIFTNLRSML
jgi:hypothetical protein